MYYWHIIFIAWWVGVHSPACRQVGNKDPNGMMPNKMNIKGMILRTLQHAKALRIVSPVINMMSLRLILIYWYK